MIIDAALVGETGGPFAVRRLDPAEPEGDEIRVRIMAVGTCRTGLIVRVRFHPTRRPALFGHEGAGGVEAMGPDVATVRPGTRS